MQTLYEQYGNRIQLYLYTLCSDFAAAEDLTQETFLKAMLDLPKDQDNLGAWLYTVARRLCLTRIKRDKWEQPSQDAEAQGNRKWPGGR
ncbi:MAG: RNA polymerase sigma factor [Firmicutes bacterium]|nr:RNA polymerase sigma factor [Bacillota bacterium]